MRQRMLFGVAFLAMGVILFGLIRHVQAADLIRIDGSSTVFPITEAVAEELQKKNPRARIAVGVSGTGGGFKKFCNNETDIQDASRPIKPSEVELCKKNRIEYIELPIAYDGLVLVVNPQNSWATNIMVKELKRLWEPGAEGRVTRWSQIRPGWPNKEIHLFGPGVDSGTYDYFTEAIVGKEHSSRGDYTSSEDDNVLVQGISTDPLGLGFFGVAYYEENKERLKLVPVDDEDPANGKGPILPTYENVAKGLYQPLSRPLFIYVSRRGADRPEVKEFVKFYLTSGRLLVKETGYIVLPDKVYDLALSRFEKQVIGSIFKGRGSQVGVTLEDLLKAEGR